MKKSIKKSILNYRLSCTTQMKFKIKGGTEQLYVANDFIPFVQSKESNGKNFAEYR